MQFYANLCKVMQICAQLGKSVHSYANLYTCHRHTQAPAGHYYFSLYFPLYNISQSYSCDYAS
jgi:hypothetical protein